MKIIFEFVEKNPGWFEWLAYVIIPVAITFFTIRITTKNVNDNTNKQIAAQNKETYRPRLRPVAFQTENRNMFNPEYMYFHGVYDNLNSFDTFVKISLDNIGSGLANDITFYSLESGKQIISGRSVEKTINQFEFSTEEIPVNSITDFHFSFSISKKIIDKIDKSGEAFCPFICNYKDLNGNNYSLLIMYSFKGKKLDSEITDDCFFDWGYYQQDTYHYKNMIKKYSENYNKILKLIEEDSELI